MGFRLKRDNVERVVEKEFERESLLNDGYKLLEEKQDQSTTDFNQLTVDQLKELAKEKNIEGISNMKKEDLIKALEGGK
ncbi:hypothetical protein LF65_02278 [Clostridium beijerinckii]|uniref:Rho termination factor-like N-terminal domain-containing protein n=1 Tax=Clostridium beijerinckii TaxID=1520 RepID=A0A0B5Q9F7_CLOBE|nr:Rho termination factor N-terminal domain-containing protein [Clostridium beijerinckii]AJG98864.1 hypothetical protein LF65_02278 [Clostridium beijerinckii]